MKYNSLSVIILAAGKGSRMKSDLPKVMHKVAGCEMLNHVINNAKSLSPKNINLILSYDMIQYKDYISSCHSEIEIKYILQQDPKGTGHAIKVALENIKKQDLGQDIVVLYADTPLLKPLTIAKLVDNLSQNDISVAAFSHDKDNMYGRLVIDDNNNLCKIVEFKDATLDQKSIKICNSGIIAFSAKVISSLIDNLTNNNAAKEYYLTQLIEIANDNNLKCGYEIIKYNEVIGVNNKIELAYIEEIFQQEISHKLMSQGVTIINPKSCYFAYDVKIGKNCIIYPNIFIDNNVEIKDNVTINSFSHIEGAIIGDNAIIGPFARIRPQTLISDNCKIGNFVEIKKSTISKDVKISHLSYIGDSEIEENSNIGAGVVTCNYDGKKKFKTKIGKNNFIGSNTSIIAPLVTGDNVMIGAGSVINKDVNDGNLAIARAKQVNLKKNYLNNDKKS
jgi:bifunctional UDP-N-acetylglucosamine pyrophosphorylase/glucosamine-1-phosphate N-acetyltransferase